MRNAMRTEESRYRKADDVYMCSIRCNLVRSSQPISSKDRSRTRTWRLSTHSGQRRPSASNDHPNVGSAFRSVDGGDRSAVRKRNLSCEAQPDTTATFMGGIERQEN